MLIEHIEQLIVESTIRRRKITLKGLKVTKPINLLFGVSSVLPVGDNVHTVMAQFVILGFFRTFLHLVLSTYGTDMFPEHHCDLPVPVLNN